MRAQDVRPVAALYAERNGGSLAEAADVVEGWADDPARIVLVACHDDVVRGYAKAERLDPAAGGGEAPTGWYLSGMVVDPHARRQGIGRRLTEERIRLLSDRADELWYFANLSNHASIALHEELGFVEHTRDFRIPGVTFAGGRGALFRRQLR